MLFAIGDVHGRFDLLTASLEYIKNTYEPVTGQDYIILLGDYIDRGPQSRQIIEFLIKHPEIICLKGNHEDMMEFTLNNPSWYANKEWFKNGGAQTMLSYGADPEDIKYLDIDLSLIPQEHIDWLENLPTRVESENYIFVHAGIAPNTRLDDNDDDTVMWIRDEFLAAPASAFPDKKRIVHGHTVLWYGREDMRLPEILPHRVNLDTGACFTGIMTIGAFKDEDLDFIEIHQIVATDEDYN